jgi:antitoxin HigA-1
MWKCATTIDGGKVSKGMKRLSPIHPGEILLEEFMKPLELSQNALARNLGVDPRTVNQIVNGKRAITAIMALRLARYFRMTPGFWMNLQARYDLETAKDAAEAEIRRTVKPRPMKLSDAAA